MQVKHFILHQNLCGTKAWLLGAWIHKMTENIHGITYTVTGSDKSNRCLFLAMICAGIIQEDDH